MVEYLAVTAGLFYYYSIQHSDYLEYSCQCQSESDSAELCGLPVRNSRSHQNNEAVYNPPLLTTVGGNKLPLRLLK